jgi:hypothetical protein
VKVRASQSSRDIIHAFEATSILPPSSNFYVPTNLACVSSNCKSSILLIEDRMNGCAHSKPSQKVRNCISLVGLVNQTSP